MNRREMLLAGATLAAVSSTVGAHEDAGHEHHHHGGGKHAALLAALAECVACSRTCIAHCLALFEHGDTETARCARMAYDVQAVSGTLMVIVHSDSPHLPAYAKVAASFCHDCREACLKHADKHEVCKACADACKTCAELCEQTAAAA